MDMENKKGAARKKSLGELGELFAYTPANKKPNSQ
jgi:hypothetical protein